MCVGEGELLEPLPSFRTRAGCSADTCGFQMLGGRGWLGPAQPRCCWCFGPGLARGPPSTRRLLPQNRHPPCWSHAAPARGALLSPGGSRPATGSLGSPMLLFPRVTGPAKQEDRDPLPGDTQDTPAPSWARGSSRPGDSGHMLLRSWPRSSTSGRLTSLWEARAPPVLPSPRA